MEEVEQSAETIQESKLYFPKKETARVFHSQITRVKADELGCADACKCKSPIMKRTYAAMTMV